MDSQAHHETTEVCPECRGTGKISARNCAGCDASGVIIVHSHPHRHGETRHDHPHAHPHAHHPGDDTPHDHRHR